MKTIYTMTLLLLVQTVCIHRAEAWPAGKLDMSFNQNGTRKVVFDLGGTEQDTVEQVAVQSDGKIIVGATVDTAIAGPDRDMILFRLNQDGSFDSSFNNTGSVVISFNFGTGKRDILNDLLIQPDGRILVLGSVEQSAVDDFDIYLARFNVDGSLDTSFSQVGYRIIHHDLGAGNTDEAASIVLRSNGKIVVASRSSSTFGQMLVLTGFNADGSDDNSFGINPNDNNMPHQIGEPIEVKNMVETTNNKLLVGSTLTLSASDSNILLTQFKADGSLDTGAGSIGVNGQLELDSTADSIDRLGTIVTDNSGNIHLIGTTQFEFVDPFLGTISVLKCVGSSLSPTAATGQLLEIDFDQEYAQCFDLVIEPWSQKPLIIGASSGTDYIWRTAMIRIKDMSGDGSLFFPQYDDGFGDQDGRSIYQIGVQENFGEHLALGSQGHIVMASNEALDDILITRLINDKDLIFYSDFD